MDLIDINQAVSRSIKALGKNGQIGKTTWDYIGLHYDGNQTDKDTFDGTPFEQECAYVHISDSIVAGGQVKSASVMLKNGNVFNIPLNNLQTITTDDGIWMLVWQYINKSFIIAISFGKDVGTLLGVSAGTYFSTETTEFSYTESVYGNLVETIHPIDPKYLPGVCLPVVELSTMDGELTANESAAMNKVAAMGAPVVVKVISGESTSIVVFNCTVLPNGVVFAATMNGITVQIDDMSGTWKISTGGS